MKSHSNYKGRWKGSRKKHEAHDISGGKFLSSGPKHNDKRMAGPDTSEDREIKLTYGVKL